jgi:DNA-binding transcriptional ArsR family regulator
MSKHENIDKQATEMASVFRGLSDPYRLSVLTALIRTCGAGARIDMAEAVEDASRVLNMSPSHVEQQLMELWRAGLLLIGEAADGRLEVEIDAGILKDAAGLLGDLDGNGHKPGAS